MSKKIRKALACALMGLCSLPALSVEAYHQLFPVSQGDGTTVLLYKWGNDGLAFYSTEDGRVVVRDSLGMLCYARLSDGQLRPTAVVVHNVGERTAAERALRAQGSLTLSDPTVRRLMLTPRQGVRRVPGASTADGLGRYGTSALGSLPSLGVAHVPVVMVEFSDTKFQPGSTVEKMDRYFNEAGYREDSRQQQGSVRDYFLDQSGGAFDPHFDVVAKVTLDYGYATYGANSQPGRAASDVGVLRMVTEAIAKAVGQDVDFSKYYHSKTHTVANVIFLYAGPGEATGGDENTIWPHERTLADQSHSYVTLSGYRFSSYFVGNEIMGTSSSTNLMGMGVMVHELSHALGLPDFYATDYSYSGDNPFGGRDVLDGGQYRGSAYAPVGYSAFEKSNMGWIDLRALDGAEAVTLTDNCVGGNSDFAVVLRNPDDEKEYFILENQQSGKWSDGAGMMLSHFTYDLDTWRYNQVNNKQDYKRAFMVTANGAKVTSQDKADDAHLFGNGVNHLASVRMFDGAARTKWPLYDVVCHSDRTVTFSFLDPALRPASIANDGSEWALVSSMDDVTPGDSVLVVSRSAQMALGVRHQGNAHSASQVVFGEGKVWGNADVERFALLRSKNTGKWAFRSSAGRYLGVSANGLSSLASANATAMADISIDGGVVNVRFGDDARYLCFVAGNAQFASDHQDSNDIQLYIRHAESTGITSPALGAGGDAARRRGVWTITGQRVSQSPGALPRGLYVIDGKKVVVK